MKNGKQKMYRIIDANLNRSREGLRVCEEIVRFVISDKQLTKDLRNIRHNISKIAEQLPVSQKELINERNVHLDLGKNFGQDNERKNSTDIFTANIKRAQEALRVLEEFSHILSGKTSDNFRRFRFESYRLEKKIIERFSALSNTG